MITILLLSGLNFWLRDALAPIAGGWEPVAGWQPLLVALYFLALALAVTIIDLPLSHDSGYVLPHRYGLSTQSRAGWAWDLSKGWRFSLPSSGRGRLRLLAAGSLARLVVALDLAWRRSSSA